DESLVFLNSYYRKVIGFKMCNKRLPIVEFQMLLREVARPQDSRGIIHLGQQRNVVARLSGGIRNMLVDEFLGGIEELFRCNVRSLQQLAAKESLQEEI